MNTSHLPSGNFMMIVGAVAISAGLIFFVSYERKTEAPLENLEGKVAQALPDTDGDGIKDWEELLRGTDANVRDTDGDGTADGEEAAAGRDPLKPGPEDTLTPPAELPDFATVISTSTKNLTEAVSQTLFASYVGVFGQGLAGDPYAQERAALEAASRVKLEPRGEMHTQRDLAVVSDKAENYRLFGNEVIRAISKHRTASFPSAAVALGQLVDYEREDDLIALEAVGEEYSALIQDLLLVPTPSSLAPLYLETLNSLERTAGSFTDMHALFTDPVRALAGVRAYQGYLTETTRLFTLIAKELDNKGILFKESEGGYAWRKLRELAP